MLVYVLMFKRPFLDKKTTPTGFVTDLGFLSRDHLTRCVFPTCHTLCWVGAMILGTHTSLVTRSIGTARIEEAEKRRTAKVVVDFILIVELVS